MIIIFLQTIQYKKTVKNNKDSINELKSNCLISAKKYQPDEYIKKIVNVITES